MSGKYLGIQIIRSEELKNKLQTTLEKEPDFLRTVESDQGERFILHLEFQSQDEEGMIYRMQEYYGILRKKYQLPVRQFVIYLGARASRMQTQLAAAEIFDGFSLKSLRDYSYQGLVSSEIPEEIILAILSDFSGKEPLLVLGEILDKLQEVSGEEINLRKYIRQLAILSRLRNLVKETQQQVQAMGLTYNIEQDFLYRQGIEKGIEKGLKVKEKNIVCRMLKDKTLTVEKIAELAEVSVNFVQQIAKELKKQ